MSLKLAVLPVGRYQPKWLDDQVSKPSLKIYGVPLESGTFRFRLDARDRINQVSTQYQLFFVTLCQLGNIKTKLFIERLHLIKYVIDNYLLVVSISTI